MKRKRKRREEERKREAEPDRKRRATARGERLKECGGAAGQISQARSVSANSQFQSGLRTGSSGVDGFLRFSPLAVCSRWPRIASREPNGGSALFRPITGQLIILILLSYY